MALLEKRLKLAPPVSEGNPKRGTPSEFFGFVHDFTVNSNLLFPLACMRNDIVFEFAGTGYCNLRQLVIAPEFNGILPKETREKARAAKVHFDKLYLIVDQQHRWKSVLLPDPRPRTLDPLLIGELKQGRGRKYYLIHQFELTEAEQYLADEFATKPDEDYTGSPTTENQGDGT